MKRVATSFLLGLLFLSVMHAAPVDQPRAENAAIRWMRSRGGSEHASLTVGAVYPFVRAGVTTHYLVTLVPEGYVIVAGDDIAWPVLMYAPRGGHDGAALPPALEDMLTVYAEDLLTDIAHRIPATEATLAMWSELDAPHAGGFLKGGGHAGIASVSPLIEATWNQTTPYNQDCPATPSGGSGGHVYVGCVATAMAMVMHYWQHPAIGAGSHSYTHPTYGTLGADFGSTTYDWAAMPNSINTNSPPAAKAAIALISYHAGVSVDMDYSPTGSGSFTTDARDALVAYFRYKSTAQHRWRSSYGTTSWNTLLTTELNAGRPVIYRGAKQNGSDGHAFIVDGFQGSDYFHMNFGWGGSLDGYCYLNDITPGSNNFTYFQGMITGIEPLASPAPTLAAPAHQSAGVCVTPTLRWNAASGATSYRVQVGTNATFTAPVYDNASITGTSVGIPGLSRGQTYYWRVNTTGSGGTSPWSTTWQFTTRMVTITAGGPSTFCEGGSVTLHGNAASGVTFQWSRNGAVLPGAVQSSLLVSESGSYVLTVMDNGCPTSSDPFPVTVHPLPVAQIIALGGLEICQGTSLILEAVQTPGASYQWRRDGSIIPAATAPVFIAYEAGLYVVSVEHNGCGQYSLPVSVSVSPSDPDAFVWVGGPGRDWSEPANWGSPCAVPGPGDDVTIPSGIAPPQGIPAISLGNLAVENAEGIALHGTVSIAGVLSLGGGNIILGDHDLIIESTGSIVGGGGSRRIVTNGSGALYQWNLGSSGRSAAVLFPVAADAGSYTPLTITNTGAASGFGVRVSTRVLGNGRSGAPLAAGVVDRTWYLSAASGQINATLQFSWTAGEELTGFDRAQCFVSRNDAGLSWEPMQQPAAAQGSGLFTRMVSGVTSIGADEIPFAMGSGGTLYPVELLSFEARIADGCAQLSWSTTNEVNNFGFRVQRRDEAHSWTDVGFVAADRTAATLHSYSWRDRQPLVGEAEFRLAQIDLDGSVHFSTVLALTGAGMDVPRIDAVHPQPLRPGDAGIVTISSGVDADARLTLADALGRELRVLFEGRVPSSSSRAIPLPTRGLSPGLYFLRLVSAAGSRVQRMLIAR